MELRDDPHRDPGCAWIYLPRWRRRWLPWHHSRGRCPSLGGRQQQDRHSGTWLRHGVVADGVEGRGWTEAAAARCSSGIRAWKDRWKPHRCRGTHGQWRCFLVAGLVCGRGRWLRRQPPPGMPRLEAEAEFARHACRVSSLRRRVLCRAHRPRGVACMGGVRLWRPGSWRRTTSRRAIAGAGRAGTTARS
ncbi:unnamed protein product, partial [Symbiodinium sp. CCMP2456]